MKKIFLLAFSMAVCLTAFSQFSILRGTITNAGNGETVAFANILVKELGTGTSSDLDGQYVLELPPGKYTLQLSFIGFSNLEISEIELIVGETKILDIQLSEETEILKEVVVTAAQLRNTENTVLLIQKKSLNLLDGISAQSFKKTGDGDAASAVQRVTGVSVESGKHVFVRGLGDRYSKTILNGLDIPGLDPDRNSVQMDIFPSNLLDNLLVYKSFTPDLPGDFTGGLINIATKDFPEERTLNIGMTLSYSPTMHFRKDFLKYDGAKTDFLGFDDGSRAFPFRKTLTLPDPTENNKELTRFTRLFNPAMAATTDRNDLNKSFAVSTGNQYNLKGNNTVGFIAALNYRYETSFYENVVFNTYRKSANADVFSLDRETNNEGTLGQTSAFWSALIGGSWKKERFKISLNAMRIQSGESSAAQFIQTNGRENPAIIQKDNLEYSERAVSNILLRGKHNLSDGALEIDWSLSPTLSEIDEPDIRLSGFEIEEGNYYIRPSVGAVVTRTWRELIEQNYSARADMKYQFKLKNGLDSELKIGLGNSYKDRYYSILNYFFRLRNDNLFDFSGNADEIFIEENIWNVESGAGLYAKGNFEPANTYDAQQNIASGYFMHTLPLNQNLKAVYGLRMEKVQNWYTGQNNSGTLAFDKQRVLDETDFLPSASLIYTLSENTNFRSSYSRTLARPSFKEKSIAQIQDRISGRSFIGNIDLQETHIQNFDLRWESYGGEGQMFVISAFYKSFVNPIELVAYNESSPNDFQPINVGDAMIWGLEFELRRRVPEIPGFSLGTNITLVEARVEMKEEEYQSRINNSKTGEFVSRKRDMVGQSPYVVNAYLNFQDSENNLEANLSYNVQGKRLSIVGIGRNPDVYEQAFHGLNFRLSAGFGEMNSYRFSIGFNNILNASRIRDYEDFSNKGVLFERFEPGRQFSLGLSYQMK